MNQHRTDGVVTGTIAFEKAFHGAAGAVARVLVEEVTRADAPATVVARLDIPLQGALPQGALLPFMVQVGPVDAALRYVVRVHIDSTGNGRLKSGDQISPASNPVLTHGASSDVKVVVVPLD